MQVAVHRSSVQCNAILYSWQWNRWTKSFQYSAIQCIFSVISNHTVQWNAISTHSQCLTMSGIQWNWCNTMRCVRIQCNQCNQCNTLPFRGIQWNTVWWIWGEFTRVTSSRFPAGTPRSLYNPYLLSWNGTRSLGGLPVSKNCSFQASNLVFWW